MLEDYLHSYFQDVILKRIFNDVIGSDDPKVVQPIITQAISRYFDTGIQNILFIESSIGVVFGFLLANGNTVILKIFSEKLSNAYLVKMHEVQQIFFQEKFPVPEVLSPIFRLGKSNAGFYQFIKGRKEDAHQAKIRLELAKYLAKFSNIVDQYQLPPLENFFQASLKKLWPTPHNVLFDLKKTTKGAGWIANYAKKAKKILSSSHLPVKLAHTDWGIKNATFFRKKLVGVFDWDSLGAMSECQMLGQACAQFTADWESDFKITPSPLEARDFVKDYEKFRNKEFTEEEYRIISAAADYLIAIIARFEHAGNAEQHPYQDLLKQCGKNSFLFAG